MRSGNYEDIKSDEYTLFFRWRFGKSWKQAKFGEKVVIIPAGIEVVTGFTDTFLENRKGITYHDNSGLENMRENKWVQEY